MALAVNITCVLLAVIIIYVISKLYKFIQHVRTISKQLEGIPSAERHWLFGSVKEIAKAGSFSDFLFGMHDRFVAKGEKFYIFWLFFHHPVVVVAHPDTAKDILRSSEPKTEGKPGYDFLDGWIGDSILKSKGRKWERNRHLLTPAFHFDILQPYVKIYNQVVEVFMEKMQKSIKDGKSFEVFKPAGLAALDILLQCALSYQGKIQQLGDSHPYIAAVQKLGKYVVERSYSIHLYPDFCYKLSTQGKDFYKLCDYVHNFSAKIITERKKILADNQDILKKRYLDFLDILLTAEDEEGQGLSDEEIQDEVDAFLFAGHDTTSSALSWSIYSLSKYPEKQEKLYNEVRQVLNGKDTVEWEDLTKMKYLSCYLKEVLRLYSPVPAVSRTLSKPYVIGGVTVPVGTHIDLGLFHIHHHPLVWTDPLEFIPERFESEDILNKDPYSFVPFSAGPRNCIGQNFAQNELKVFIARIVKRFKVLLDPDHEPEPFIEVMMRSKTGIHVKLMERENGENC